MISLLFTGVHTIFLRAHNIVAQGIFQVAPEAFPDLIYEEAKKFVIAYFQRIVYEEWLPILLGPAATTQYLSPLTFPLRTTYDPTVNNKNIKS